jgi:type VI secretion system FHA domain protein
MILTLEVLPPQASALGDAGRRAFSARGGTIGRASSCDWVLSHRKVSGRHATISYQDGIFYIVDEQSANGVFINSSKNRLVPGRRYALKDGDRIIIDPYEMDVSIAADRGGAHYNPFDAADPFAPTGRTPVPSAAPVSTPRPQRAGEAVPLEELDPLKLLDGNAKPAPRQAPSARDLENASPLAGHYQPPAVLTPPPAPVPPNAVVIPADYDPLADDSEDGFEIPPPPPARPAPPRPDPAAVPPPPVTPLNQQPAAPTPPPRVAATPAPRATPTPAPPARAEAPAVQPDAAEAPHDAAEPHAGSGLREVLAGAGLVNAPVTLEFARGFGQIFRVVVSGVMDVLRARQQIKDEFRMRLTQFRPADNNPLKFSANVDDALHNLLVKRNAAYLEPVEAFEDAFDDLRDHQMAMLAGMRVAFEAMLAQFEPDRLQDDFDRQMKRSALLGVTARLKYWELYRERHEAMARDPEATFRQLFGEEFAKAYEEQLRRLKAERRDRPAGPRPPEA